MLILADARAIPLASGSVQMVMTSPPYWGLRDYGVSDQIGLEPTPDAYVAQLVQVFREVRRVLRDDGTVWLNLGDCYNAYNGNRGASAGINASADAVRPMLPSGHGLTTATLKPKDLVGIPWRVAFALQADGWYLRSDIIWAKGVSFLDSYSGSVMPESVRDRPTRGHEYLFLLTKSPHYYYDYEAVQEQGVWPAGTRAAKGSGTREGNRRGPRKKDVDGGRVGASARTQRGDFQDRWDRKYQNPDNATTISQDGYAIYSGKRNLRDVWVIGPRPYRGAHFATFPPALVIPTVRAGSRPGDLVLDPFVGSGTVGAVCEVEGRRFVGMDLNPEYLKLATARIEEARRKGKA